jgi:hypothetical protein
MGMYKCIYIYTDYQPLASWDLRASWSMGATKCGKLPHYFQGGEGNYISMKLENALGKKEIHLDILT